jgi:hypothetical protein
LQRFRYYRERLSSDRLPRDEDQGHGIFQAVLLVAKGLAQKASSVAADDGTTDSTAGYDTELRLVTRLKAQPVHNEAAAHPPLAGCPRPEKLA